MARKEKTYNVLYKTTCNIDQMYYIGIHSTNNLDDGYLGSGQKLWHKIRYHGKENFSIEYLEFFKTRKELSDREIEIVNESLIKDPMCMNLCLGGDLGFTQEQLIRGAKTTSEKVWKDPIFVEMMKKTGSETMSNLWKDPEFVKKATEAGSKAFKGKTHSIEFKERMSKVMSEKQSGSKNSQFGKIWVYNLELKESKKIEKNELDLYLRSGWSRGRKMKFQKFAEVAQWQSKPAKTGRDAIGSIPAFGSKNNP